MDKNSCPGRVRGIYIYLYMYMSIVVSWFMDIILTLHSAKPGKVRFCITRLDWLMSSTTTTPFSGTKPCTVHNHTWNPFHRLFANPQLVDQHLSCKVNLWSSWVYLLTKKTPSIGFFYKAQKQIPVPPTSDASALMWTHGSSVRLQKRLAPGWNRKLLPQ